MKKHILLYTDDFGLGGVAQYNHSILLGLVKRGYRVSCVHTQSENPLIEAERAAGVEHLWLDFDTSKDFQRTLRNSADAHAIFVEQQPDLILFSDACPLSNFAAKQVAIALKIPYVIVEGFVAPYLAERFANLLDTLELQYLQASNVVAVSQENLECLHQLFRLPWGKGAVIYHGRPPEFFAPRDPKIGNQLRQSMGIPEDAIVCFTSGRLDPIKGYQYQLEAIAQLRQMPIWEKLYFIWAGEGFYRPQLEQQIEALGVGDRVLLLGHRWDVADWCNAADIFVLPSQLEGMPLAVMEAMAKGIPVIASAVSGIPEELGNTGKLLPDPKVDPVATVQELLTTIKQWVSDSDLRERIGTAEQQRAEQFFQENRMVADTIWMVERSLLPGDYISPGFAVTFPDAAFPNKIVGDPQKCGWPHLRREILHNWYVDQRHPIIGFLSRDEAHILYNTALQFKGKRALEIGCWMGWSACHLALAGVQLDVVDPLLDDPTIGSSVKASLEAAGVLPNVQLLPGYSPQRVEEIAAQHQRRWSLIFIDGNHDAPGPLEDAIACEKLAEPDALIVFHDLASPEVAEGLDYFQQQGWNTLVYQTMQIMGVAWRGNVKPVLHQPDPLINWQLPLHLQHHPVSGVSLKFQVSVLLSKTLVERAIANQAALRTQDLREFQELLGLIQSYTLLSEARLFSLYSLAKQVCIEDLPGNFVECGTCRGGSAALLAAVIKRYSRRSRKLFACDTFEGMPDPTDVDRHEGIPANDTGLGAGTLNAPIEANLKAVCHQLNVWDLITPLKGLFADTLPSNREAIGAIALLHADGDWYESTMDIFNNLFDQVVEHGAIQIDDYGFWEGCRLAVHDFEQQRGLHFPLVVVDETGVWFRKVQLDQAVAHPWAVHALQQLIVDLPSLKQSTPDEQILFRLSSLRQKVAETIRETPLDELLALYQGNIGVLYKSLLSSGFK